MQGFARIFAVATMSMIFGTAASSRRTSMDYHALVAKVGEGSQVHSIGGVLEEAYAMVPAFFQDFSLMYESGSLQQGSYQSPRAIVYGADASFIMTFHNDPRSQGYDVLEMLGFRYESQSPLGKAAYDFNEFKEVAAGQAIHVAPTNQGKCMRCHYSELRPIWPEYDGWPGAYGSEDDALIDFKAANDIERQRLEGGLSATRYGLGAANEQKLFAKVQKEHDEFQFFRQKVHAEPQSRYRFLGFRGNSPVAPYTTAARSGTYPLRPNLNLVHALSQQHAKRLAYMMRANGACYQRYAEAAVATFLGCDGISCDATRPDDDCRQRQAVAKAMNASLHAIRRYQADVSALGPWNEQSPTTKEDYVRILSLFGLEKEDWNLAARPTEWQYYTGERYTETMVMGEIYTDLRKANPSLPLYGSLMKELYPNYEFEGDDYSEWERENGSREQNEPYGPLVDASYVARMCRALAPIIQAKLDQGPNWGKPCDPVAFEEPGELPHVVKMCASCHDEAGESAPPIPFLRQDLIAANKSWQEAIKRRVESQDARLRMPPDRPLTRREKQALRRYVDGEK